MDQEVLDQEAQMQSMVLQQDMTKLWSTLSALAEDAIIEGICKTAANEAEARKEERKLLQCRGYSRISRERGPRRASNRASKIDPILI